jgi:UDP-2-acetamido-2-deoxy-ribo-hexuluronate aminotransferase
MTKVPFIDLTRLESGFIDGVKTEVFEALDRAQFVGGPQIEGLENDLKKYTSAPFAISCANGTDAIQLALRAAGVEKGDKVLVPEMTFWASVEAIFNVGAIPICVDVSNETLHLSFAEIRAAAELHKPKALILVHLYGWAAPETEEIRKFCQEKNLLLIEDSAQAFGTKFQNRDLIGSAEIATTSFYPAKVLGASGDAGAVFFKSKTLADSARSLSNHGRISHYQHGSMGWNSRIGVYESIFLRHSLRVLDQRIASRRSCLAQYRKQLAGIEGIQVLGPAADVVENGYLNVLRVDPMIRDSLRSYLSEQNIATGVVYPEPMSTQPGFRKYYAAETNPRNAMAISRSIINLPCFPGINEKEISYTCDALRKFFS